MNQAFAILLTAYFIGLLALIIINRLYLKRTQSYLLRAFLPSWRFFEELGQVPSLFYRVRMKPSDPEFGAWHACLKKIERRPQNLLLNAEGNSLLAKQSLIQQLLHEMSELPVAPSESVLSEFTASTSYQLTRAIALDELSRHPEHRDALEFQFKLAAIDTTLPIQKAAWEDILLSPTYRLNDSEGHQL